MFTLPICWYLNCGQNWQKILNFTAYFQELNCP